MTYVNWRGYEYTRAELGVDARPAFELALSGVQVAVKNQDNHGHDLFDADDYLQFHGGMIATIRSLNGRNPRRYFGDTSDPDRPLVRDLRGEASRVFRTRVMNPKWLDAMKRHGDRGATGLSTTLDYIFGYDATAKVVEDWQYTRLAETYALDDAMRAFFAASNAWALCDIVSRLLEAAQRGLWRAPADVLAGLQHAYLQAEAAIEGRASSGPAPVSDRDDLVQRASGERAEAPRERRGLVVVNTGDGKGKTTAALGLALRAVGHRMRMVMVQFIKGQWTPGEIKAARRSWHRRRSCRARTTSSSSTRSTWR